MAHPQEYSNSRALEAHLLDAHGRDVHPGEDAARRGLDGLRELHEAAHAEALPGYGYAHRHAWRSDTERDADTATMLDRSLAVALLMALTGSSSPQDAEDLVRDRLVAVHDSIQAYPKGAAEGLALVLRPGGLANLESTDAPV